MVEDPDIRAALRRLQLAEARVHGAWRARHGVDANGHLALVLLADGSPIAPTEMGTVIGVDGDVITDLIARLEDAGLLRRQLHADGERFLLSLTKLGLRALEDLDRMSEPALKLFRELREQERVIVATWLDSAAAALHRAAAGS